MTKEEIEKILEEKQWIVDYTIHKDFPIFRDDEDVRQIALITMWRCLDKYEEDRGATMESYIRKCITNKLRNEIKKRTGVKYAINDVNKNVSLDNVVKFKGKDAGSEITYHEIIPDTSNKGIIINLQEYFDGLNDTDREIIYLRSRGKTMKEIGRKQMCSKQNVKQKCERLKKILKETCILD